ncbi:hypothetical protein RhiXN_11279 [Rhizoctonia solani]|uniref:Uncharacterized protein n=1 Tax=Rhizoctonia solani TaxID=456999 RepID=A0A8H8P4V6_9AGAM|nr:uncharacterized protein RhiXN_11275 [Rhizoctonia solani]XP_043184604.1 uncharacterized protein RhiXN_11279 [Rhizoctonia solani]QRW24363.1 hypothetical protein RhiXN_11275 [Rhizoctonia solani]QRW24367.1 hypothetical protein RhiXN_11279 [Rhizoctonia solani]
MTAKRVPAMDQIKMSFDQGSLVPVHALPQEILKFPDHVGIEHLIILLDLMAELAFDYNLLKDNCWVFCQAMIDCMEVYQKNPIKLRRPMIGEVHRRKLKTLFIKKIRECGKPLVDYGCSS